MSTHTPLNPDATTSNDPPRDGQRSETSTAPEEATSPIALGGGKQTATALALLVGGSVGLAAAITLLLEKLKLLADPAYVPSCSIDPILSCGSIMRTAQAEIFGFPNPILGLVAFPVVITCGALIAARVSLPSWFWVGLQVGATAGVVLVHWLIVQSLVVIGALCPYCVAIWAATIAIFWYVTARNLTIGVLEGGRTGLFLARRRGAVIATWYAAIAAAIVAAFPSYWLSFVGIANTM